MATLEKTATNNFDFAELVAEETAVVPIINPNTGEDIPGVTMEIYSPESQVFKDAAARFKARFFQFLSQNPGVRMFVKQRESDRLERERNISCIKSINGFVFNKELLTDPLDICDKFEFVYVQLCNALANHSNFTKSSSVK